MMFGFGMEHPEQYYARALSIAREREGSGTPILVFSDDPDWCREQPVFKDACIVSGVENAPPYHDMFFLSQCKALVMANSSFSWWAAWFASRRGARIIAPGTWLYGKSTRSLRLVPDDWILVDAV